MENNIISKRLLYIDFETTKSSGRPRYRWQAEVKEDG
jgi:hypothetical protein